MIGIRASVLDKNEEGMLFICKIDARFLFQKTKKMLSLLSKEERKKNDSFKFKKDANLYLVSKFLIRKIIISLTKTKNNKIIFRQNKYGKPRLKYPPIKNFHFNLSHSGEYVVLALSKKPIGVDIEEVRPVNIKLLGTQLHKKEQKELNSCKNHKEKAKKFFTIWTLKEAYAKAIGQGLSLPIKDFYFKFDEKKIFLCGQKDKNLWYFKTYHPNNSYFLSLCSRYKKFPRLKTFYL